MSVHCRSPELTCPYADISCSFASYFFHELNNQRLENNNTCVVHKGALIL